MGDTNTTDLIRQYASVQNIVRVKQVSIDLGIHRDKVQYAIHNLVDQEYLSRIGHGMYQYQDSRENPAKCEVEDRIWRAMRINPTFSASEVARQSGSTRDYVYKRFREFRAEGIIKPAGRKSNLGGGFEKIWRLTPKGTMEAKKPNEVKFTPDPLIEDTVSLNRLICTGMVKAKEESRTAALELLEKINDGLKKLEEV